MEETRHFLGGTPWLPTLRATSLGWLQRWWVGWVPTSPTRTRLEAWGKVGIGHASKSKRCNVLFRRNPYSHLYFIFLKLESSSCRLVPTVGWGSSTTEDHQDQWATCRWARGSSSRMDTTGGEHAWLSRRNDIQWYLSIKTDCCGLSVLQTGRRSGSWRQHGPWSSPAQHDALWFWHGDVLAQPSSATAAVSSRGWNERNPDVL